ncbi:MAG: hypothetical protein AAFN13_08200 [Bacteroidota bacterium]
MGQQQLLLLVLGIVIVGLAVASGIEAFAENDRKAKQDRFISEAVGIAAEIVTWQQKPTAMGGNGEGNDLSAISLQALGRAETRSAANYSRHDSDERRLIINRSNSARPLVQVHDFPVSTGALLVEIAMWGPKQACWTMRWRARESSWVVKAGSLSNPDSGTCSW